MLAAAPLEHADPHKMAREPEASERVHGARRGAITATVAFVALAAMVAAAMAVAVSVATAIDGAVPRAADLDLGDG
jgi:hypothetical protein